MNEDGTGTMAIDFTLNGEARSFAGDPDKPLLWVLREEMARPGTKFGCGAGLCGACTVHLDGDAIRSCITPVSTIAGASVTTIEGVAQGPVGKAVRAAWTEIDVPQCGYCQAGQIMSASALLAQDPAPSDEDIDGYMSGNLCRCATYTRIRQAIRAASDKLAGAAK